MPVWQIGRFLKIIWKQIVFSKVAQIGMCRIFGNCEDFFLE